MRPLRIFDNFKFSVLNEDWVQSVWQTEFLIYNEPPDEYLTFLESQDMRLLLHKSCVAITSWLEDDKDSKNCEDVSAVSWNTLIGMDINVRALLAVLGYIMKIGQKKEADEECRQSCLYATNLYFILLAIPGSKAFNIFHPNLYSRAVETIKISSQQLQPSVKKRNKMGNVDSLNSSDELTNEPLSLSCYEKQILMKNLNVIICSLLTTIKSFWFKDSVQSLNVTIHGLVELTRIEDNSMVPQHFSGDIRTEEMSMLQNAYAALQELCNNKHGPITVTITLIIKYMLPRLLCSHTDTQVKVITNIQEHTINFLKNLLYAFEKESKGAILALIQKLMLQSPDRMDARARQAVILMKLFGICKRNVLEEACNNVILLSHHSKIPARLFAQEIIGKFLLESFLDNYDITDAFKTRVKKAFFTIALNRCMDCSSIVRGKAIAVIADFTELDNTTTKSIFHIIVEESDPNKKFATFENIKHALFKDIDLLPGLNVLMAMWNERIEDERAVVRKSTLQILKNLSLMFPSLINKIVLVMSYRCRDPTLTVRRFAVQVLSQLLKQFPENSQLLNEWVRTVLPQIFDIELKVQEKVLDYIEELVLRNIENISVNNENGLRNLPWKILNTITNMKMRRHLSKACSLWAKSGIITGTLMKNIQSHIGTSNNMEAWVFLVALAENTSLPNMNKYFLNYKEIFVENNYYTSLVLQVLKFSCKSLDHDILEHLQVYLYECLQQYKVSIGLISLCLDIMYNISYCLNPDKNNNLMESNMLNLIRTSEQEIVQIFNSDNEAEEAAPNYLKALFTLGHATFLTTYKISPLTLRILQGILLEWEALPEVIKEIEELQASAVVILGQQAIRDCEIAKEVVPIFGSLMRQQAVLNTVIDTTVKINAAKALADICVRFTALAEPHLSDMCVSMKDSDPRVREAIMVIFIQLLLEDYIKIKGPFFFHILTMLFDSDSMIRELTVFLIEERLLIKNKTLISQQFLQSMYHYNNYQSQHKVYHHQMRESEKQTFTLPGEENEEKRRAIYDFMLDHLDLPGRIKLLVKVTRQILGGSYVDSIDVKKKEGACVLKDALYVISNERLRPSWFIKHNEDDQQEGEESLLQTTTPASNAANIIVEGIKKHGLEVLLPVLLNLKEKLSAMKSPLEYDVKKVLVKTYLEYNKDQLTDITSEYPNLDKEVGLFKKQMESIRVSNENALSGETSSSESDVQRMSDKSTNGLSCNLYPKVVLQRITVSKELSNGSTKSACSLSPTSISDCSGFIPSTSILHSPCEPGPSTSTPKSNRRFASEFTRVSASDVSSSTFISNEKVKTRYRIRKRNILHFEDHIESD